MQLLSINSAAIQLNCSTKTVRRAINAGELKSVRLGISARSDRIHPDDLEQFINRKRTTRAICPSINVVEFTISTPILADQELENRLAKGRQKRKRKQ